MKMDDFRQLIVTIFTLAYITFIEIAFLIIYIPLIYK